MGKRNWMLQIIFFTIVAYSILISLQNTVAKQSLDDNIIANYNVCDTVMSIVNLTDNNKTTVGKLVGKETVSLTQNGIFWSDCAELCVPKGLTLNVSFKLIETLRNQNVTSLKEGTNSMCGTSKGGIVMLQDGTILCAKYKRKQRSVYAEVLSYYLSRLLNMDNVPEVFLAHVDPSSPRWKAVQPSSLSWDTGEIVALVAWKKNCRYKTFMPSTLREVYFKQESLTSSMINHSRMLQNNKSMISDIIQWATVLIFDYLIGHFDRLVRIKPYGIKNVYDVHTDSLHNSVKSQDGKIWLIDHESAFFYRFKTFNWTYNYIRIAPFYDKMLKTVCVFQTSFVEGLDRISKHTSPFEYLFEFTLLHEPLMKFIPKELMSKMYVTIFNYRLKQIKQWIRHCQKISK